MARINGLRAISRTTRPNRFGQQGDPFEQKPQADDAENRRGN